MTEVLTVEQKAELKEAFGLFDKNGDGKISVDELEAVIRSMGQKPTREEVKCMMENMDKDGNGTIEFDEFLEMMTSRCSRDDEDAVETEMKEAFKIFDKDGNGFITKDELKDVMKSLGEVLSDEQLDEMMKECDLNGDEQVSFPEFLKMMKDKS